MAEVKKKFSELDPASVPFDGMETIAAVQGGITKRGSISGIHGAGWWDKLKAGFVDFIAPEALHANDADTLGGETSAELHNAGALTGVAPLSVIPAQLTGKNAATATLAADATKSGITSAVYVYYAFSGNPPPGDYLQFNIGTNNIDLVSYNGSTPVHSTDFAIKMVFVT